jgi:hypothetical protein
MTLCRNQRIEQRFTKVKNPKTNNLKVTRGKAERVIKTIMELWHHKTHFFSSALKAKRIKTVRNLKGHT